ncbi:hypothetical protein CHLRE_09g390652v5 [Chlamydomonas reinhardtii]|uniref:Uncharacterized protein n=1 Tax=Chlamydomonas reinhardtii TaxID=3055 RepID=A0A2K3DE41_CHLRE|nr:uncharacterized protein CHLRE_09g390652v5 [Chlamydomonas reinhardtii]XP_042921143.1 uncharacterized protein CHLRE_09g390652v5 [Chlamydomonas reinhardtii]XP_042921144.1 uncharacterized protein CHLRE_09g390652v5 [Chlamydomonas reinhardtii]PNW78801.1 hypothetical protein CHLRE_09g390652v5 [Chlamydomonas reinhardtii]PNW78802.1 hypothetical protein CHLRE_09g390652v5 [Chlamydomonas reinhardtii]PNW78803.1 hypothetical protein CHLRE_09g390652v5 [Chlamydomonas reinhardtii]
MHSAVPDGHSPSPPQRATQCVHRGVTLRASNGSRNEMGYAAVAVSHTKAQAAHVGSRQLCRTACAILKNAMLLAAGRGAGGPTAQEQSLRTV